MSFRGLYKALVEILSVSSMTEAGRNEDELKIGNVAHRCYLSHGNFHQLIVLILCFRDEFEVLFFRKHQIVFLCFTPTCTFYLL